MPQAGTKDWLNRGLRCDETRCGTAFVLLARVRHAGDSSGFKVSLSVTQMEKSAPTLRLTGFPTRSRYRIGVRCCIGLGPLVRIVLAVINVNVSDVINRGAKPLAEKARSCFHVVVTVVVDL